MGRKGSEGEPDGEETKEIADGAPGTAGKISDQLGTGETRGHRLVASHRLVAGNGRSHRLVASRFMSYGNEKATG